MESTLKNPQTQGREGDIYCLRPRRRGGALFEVCGTEFRPVVVTTTTDFFAYFFHLRKKVRPRDLYY